MNSSSTAAISRSAARCEDGITTARFDVQGVTGELRRADECGRAAICNSSASSSSVRPRCSPWPGALLPAQGELPLTVDDLRYAGRSLGALQASAHAARRRRRILARVRGDGAASAHRARAVRQCGRALPRRVHRRHAQSRGAAARCAPAARNGPPKRCTRPASSTWPADSQGDLTRALAGRFDLETQGSNGNHQLTAVATLADGQIQLANVQGTGPAADQVFRGSGRVGLVARDYDLTVDYEQVSLAATAVPTPARARLARAWNAAARFGGAPRLDRSPPDSRRVQWHGTLGMRSADRACRK